MVKFLSIVIFLSGWVGAVETEIKTDNTVVYTLDDFSQNITYPITSNTKNAVSLIIKNRAKINLLFSLRKNDVLVKFIRVPSMDSYSDTIKVNNSEILTLRPLSPPQNDVKIYPYSNNPTNI